MKLSSLIDTLILKKIIGNSNIDVTNIEIDSRKIKPGGLFVCLPGLIYDAHNFAEEAIKNGAIALLVQRELHDIPAPVTIVQVPETRRALPIIAGSFFQNYLEALQIIGVTGTNGKTTTSYMIEKVLNDNDKNTGLIGTLSMKIGDFSEETRNTTPDTLDLHRYFQKMVDNKAEYAVLEVSSHGLEMGRVRGFDFKSVVFTNLSHDHLDFHKDMESYKNSKELLFSQLGNTLKAMNKTAILNTDDNASNYYAKRTSAQIITYGIHQKADIMAKNISTTSEGSYFTIDTPWGSLPFYIKTPGIHNVYNALATISTCLLENISLDNIKRSLVSFDGVKGRFQEIRTGQNFRVIIDYAHNPVGLETTLKTAKEITVGRLICVMGCRGERDRLKRPIMANIAATHSDFVYFTSDNPLSEDPAQIIAEMVAGLIIEQSNRYEIIMNRKQAIRRAIELAHENDCVIITGRGHEKKLVMGDSIDFFTDEDVVMDSIKNF
jgi:UDP-N-acetylmuramoyl-L-alanyl-D-glutamate--2,6-diaminopimelate ligase